MDERFIKEIQVIQDLLQKIRLFKNGAFGILEGVYCFVRLL